MLTFGESLGGVAVYLWDAVILTLVATGGRIYLRTAVDTIPVRRAVMVAGLVLGLVLLAGPVAHAALTDFQWHMVQHIGLMMLVAPALVLGAPVAVLEQRRPDAVRRTLATPFVRFLLNPKVGWLLFVATLFSTHFTPVASLANTNTVVHQLVLLWFLLAGVIYYYPVLTGNPQPQPTPHAVRIISLLTMMLPETMTGFFLYTSSHALHDVRQGIDATAALHQQQAGGALMWAAAMAIDACWIALAVRDWLADEERRVDVA